MGTRSLAAAVSAFLKWASQRRSPITVAMHRRYLLRFLESVGHDDLAAVKRLDVETFSTKRHPLITVAAFFRWAVDVAELVDRTPAKGVAVPISGTRERTLDRREHAICMRRARRDYRAVLLALEETGARPKEIREMCWEHIRTVGGGRVDREQLEAGQAYFRLVRFKGRERRADQLATRTIPISPRLGRSLWRRLRTLTRVAGRIWTTLTGRAWTKDELCKRFKRLRARLVRTGEVDPVGLVAYAMRHSFATRLALQRVQGKLLADLMGHSTDRLLRRYVHPGVADLCDTVREAAAMSRPRPCPRRNPERLDERP